MNAFSLVIALSVSLGLGWTALRSTPRLALETVDNGLAVLVGALMGARLGYVVVHWSYFQTRPLDTLRVWMGGLSAAGALIGACLAVFGVSWLVRKQPGLIADRLLPLGGVLVAGTWLAGWISGAAYGQEVNAWWGLPSIDEQGLYARRIPVQLLGIIISLACYALIEARQEQLTRLPPGTGAAAWLLGTGLALYGLSYLRGDPARVLAGLRLDGWGGLAVTLIAAACLAGILLTRRRPIKEKAYQS